MCLVFRDQLPLAKPQLVSDVHRDEHGAPRGFHPNLPLRPPFFSKGNFTLAGDRVDHAVGGRDVLKNRVVLRKLSLPLLNGDKVA